MSDVLEHACSEQSVTMINSHHFCSVAAAHLDLFAGMKSVDSEIRKAVSFDVDPVVYIVHFFFHDNPLFSTIT